MQDRLSVDEDVLIYLKYQHIGAEKPASSNYIAFFFDISEAEVRQAVNRLRCKGHPVCNSADGYFYAKTRDEINGTIRQLCGCGARISDEVQGLVLSHQVFCDGTEG